MKRSIRRKAFNAALHGNPLKVIGSVKSGFQLATEVNGLLVPFGYNYDRQIDAVKHGERSCGQRAKKLSFKAAA